MRIAKGFGVDDADAVRCQRNAMDVLDVAQREGVELDKAGIGFDAELAKARQVTKGMGPNRHEARVDDGEMLKVRKALKRRTVRLLGETGAHVKVIGLDQRQGRCVQKIETLNGLGERREIVIGRTPRARQLSDRPRVAAIDRMRPNTSAIRQRFEQMWTTVVRLATVGSQWKNTVEYHENRED